MQQTPNTMTSLLLLVQQQQQQQASKNDEAPPPPRPEEDKDNNDKKKASPVAVFDDSSHAEGEIAAPAPAPATAATNPAAAAAAAKAVLLHRRHTTGEDDPQADVVTTLFDSSPASSSSSPPRKIMSSARRSLIRRFSVQQSTEELFTMMQSDRSRHEQIESCDDDDTPTRTQQQKQLQQHFYGAYGHLRRQLDYTYHKHYQKERQWLHDSIIEDFLGANPCNQYHHDLSTSSSSPSPSSAALSSSSSSASDRSSGSSSGHHKRKQQQQLLQLQQPEEQEQQQQWLIFTVGVKGAGKRHAVRKLLQSGRLRLGSSSSSNRMQQGAENNTIDEVENHNDENENNNVLFVDEDEIRRVLPEYDSYSPSRVGPLTQKEAGYIAETMVLAGLQQMQGGSNGKTRLRRQRKKQIFWDVTLHSATWFVQFITTLRLQYPALKVAILQVTADLDQVLERVHQVSFATGRTISREEILETLQQIPKSVEIVKPVTDYASVILLNNNDPAPLELVQGDWREFEQQFCCSCSSQQQTTLTTTASSVLSTTLRPMGEEAKARRRQQQETTTTSRSKSTSTMISTSMPHRGGEGVEPDTYTAANDDENKDKELRRRRHGRHQSLQLHHDNTISHHHHLLRHRRRFSVLQSTEHNHSTTSNKFYGPFAHIRANKFFLDYTYHSNYTFERQHFQDAIITHFLEAAVIRDKNGILCSTPTEPWLVFTAGAMGAGKSFTMNKLVHQGRFPLLHFVVVDPDEIRRHLPEYHLYLEHQPEMAGELTRKEAGYIAELLTLASLLAGKNTLVDGSLRDADWYCDYIAQLRREFPILHLAILHVTAPRAAVFQRAAQRAMTTGRVVPRDLLIKALDQVPRSVEKLAPLVDYTAELHNAPHADDIQLVAPRGETWDSFKEQWSQTCAWEPKHIAQTKLGGKQLTKSPPSSERLATNELKSAAKSQTWTCEPKYIAQQECGVQPLTKTPPSSEQLQQVTTAELVAAPDSDSSNICDGDGDGTASEAEAATAASAVATVSVSFSS